MQRENILPSERAQAYKMKMEAIKWQAGRPPKNAPQVAANFRSDDEVAKTDNISGDTVCRYIRLTELSPELQQMVDDKKIAMTPAVELSYLKPEEQQMWEYSEDLVKPNMLSILPSNRCTISKRLSVSCSNIASSKPGDTS